MREAAGQPTLALDSINPLYLRTAADPRMGAEFERQSVSISALAGQVQALAAEYDTLLVEGVGGWETPLCPGKTMADLAEQLQLAVEQITQNRHMLDALVEALIEKNHLSATELEEAPGVFLTLMPTLFA